MWHSQDKRARAGHACKSFSQKSSSAGCRGALKWGLAQSEIARRSLPLRRFREVTHPCLREVIYLLVIKS